MLLVNSIDVYYDKVQVLHRVSLELEENQVISIIGANGAGKTTLIKSIMGVTPKKEGTIHYCGLEITRYPTHKIVSKGIVCVPEGRRIFPKLTVLENLEMGAYPRKRSQQQKQEVFDEVYTIFPRLYERKNQLGGTLSGGEQQMLALGRALMSGPSILLLDEPSLGLAPIIVDTVFMALTKIRDDLKIPMMLVEQNAFSAMEISDFTYVLELGKVVQFGPSKQLLNDARIIKAYLGGECERSI